MSSATTSDYINLLVICNIKRYIIYLFSIFILIGKIYKQKVRSQNMRKGPAAIMSELLRKDRLEYVDMIKESKEGLRSLEIAEEILRKRKIKEKKRLSKENVLVNRRLRELTKLGILISRKGMYRLTALGHLVIDSWDNMSDKIDTIEGFGDFFENHSFESVPKEFSTQVFDLKNTGLTENASQWEKILRKQIRKTRRKLYSMTTYLHGFPDEILRRRENKEIDIVITYQFKKYPQLNFSDEKPLFDRLVEAGAQFHYIDLGSGSPIGIRIVDDWWATFLLPKTNENRLDRDHAFVGEDPNFVSWCRDLMYHMWHFRAKPLIVNEIIEKRKSNRFFD
jgi:predicted transcriptional regulator